MSTAQSLIAALRQELTVARGAHDEARARIEELERSSGFEEDRARADSAVRLSLRLQDEADAARQTIERLAGQISDAMARAAQAEIGGEKVRATNLLLKNRIEQVSAASAAQLAYMRAEVERHQAAARRAEELRERALQDADRVGARRIAELEAQASAELARARTIVDTMGAALAAQVRAHDQAVAEALRSRDAAQAARAQAEGAAAELTRQLDAARADIGIRDSALAQAQADSAQYLEHAAWLERRVAELEAAAVASQELHERALDDLRADYDLALECIGGLEAALMRAEIARDQDMAALERSFVARLAAAQADADEDAALISALRTEVEAAQREREAVCAALEDERSALAAAEAARAAVQDELVQYRMAVEASLSWRLTAPLRLLRRLLG